MRRTITDIGKTVAKANVLGTNGSIDMLRVALTVGGHIKATAPATPTPEKGGILAESRFILKHNYSSCLMTLFFNAGYVLLTHFCCNSGLAKANCFAGRWTENPI